MHHWIGLKLSLLTAVIMLTGTVAVFAYEIDWLIFPAMRVQPQDRPHASWGAWAAAARAHDRKAEIVSIAYPIDPWFSARALMARRDGGTYYVEIDPWTARVQGETPWINAHRVLRELHRHLMLPLEWGLPLVGFFGVLLLGSMVTGLMAYKKFWRGFLRVPRWRRGRPGEARRYLGDLHRFTALWGLWFALVPGGALRRAGAPHARAEDRNARLGSRGRNARPGDRRRASGQPGPADPQRPVPLRGRPRARHRRTSERRSGA